MGLFLGVFCMPCVKERNMCCILTKGGGFMHLLSLVCTQKLIIGVYAHVSAAAKWIKSMSCAMSEVPLVFCGNTPTKPPTAIMTCSKSTIKVTFKADPHKFPLENISP